MPFVLRCLVNFVREHGPLTHVDAQFIIPCCHKEFPQPRRTWRRVSLYGTVCRGNHAQARPCAAKEILALPGGKHPETGVDTGFSVLARFDNDAIFTGQFSFEGEYQNRLIVVARSGSMFIERPFSPPSDFPIVLQQRIKNAESVLKVDPSDTFANFLEMAIQAVESGEYESHYRDLLMDAKFRTHLAQAISINTAPRATG